MAGSNQEEKICFHFRMHTLDGLSSRNSTQVENHRHGLQAGFSVGALHVLHPPLTWSGSFHRPLAY